MHKLYLLTLCLLYQLHSTLAGTNCQDLRVQPINQLPPDYLSTVDQNFYKKFVNANGIPIMSSQDVSDYALKECARIIRGVTGDLQPNFMPALLKKKERIALWANNSTACSIPEVAKPCQLKDFKGGMAWGNILILQETSFQCDVRGNAWIGRVLVHEFMHAVNFVFGEIDKNLQKALNKAYNDAKQKGTWPKDEYAMVSTWEYFAVGGQTWFEANEQRHCDMKACNRGELQKKDKQLYDIVDRTCKTPTWFYKCSEFCDK